jgi:uncharacterized tellurite resistance protein B-like protein
MAKSDILPLRGLVSSKAFLGVDAEGRPADKRLRVCIAALLWEMAVVDGVLKVEEVEEIVRALHKQFGLTDEEAVETVEIIDYLKRQQSLLSGFLKEINERLNLSQRKLLFSLIHEVALADGYLHPHEKKFAEQLQIKLKLSAINDPLYNSSDNEDAP